MLLESGAFASGYQINLSLCLSVLLHKMGLAIVHTPSPHGVDVHGSI